MVWTKRILDQWKRTDSPEPEPHKYKQLIFDKGTLSGKRIVFLTNAAATTGYVYAKKMNLDLISNSRKINSNGSKV